MRETLSAVLVLFGVGVELAAALGVAAMPGVVARMHYPGLAMAGSETKGSMRNPGAMRTVFSESAGLKGGPPWRRQPGASASAHASRTP